MTGNSEIIEFTKFPENSELSVYTWTQRAFARALRTKFESLPEQVLHSVNALPVHRGGKQLSSSALMSYHGNPKGCEVVKIPVFPDPGRPTQTTVLPTRMLTTSTDSPPITEYYLPKEYYSAALLVQGRISCVGPHFLCRAALLVRHTRAILGFFQDRECKARIIRQAVLLPIPQTVWTDRFLGNSDIQTNCRTTSLCIVKRCGIDLDHFEKSATKFLTISNLSGIIYYEVANTTGTCFFVVYNVGCIRCLCPAIKNCRKARATRKACGQVEIGLQGMFGPWEPVLGAHIQSLCEALDLPHIEARLDLDQGHREFSINLHPSQNHLNAAVKDLITFLNWTRVAIVYEEDYGLFKLQELVKSPPGSRTEMYIRQANPNSYRHVLREIRQKDIFKLIVDTNPANMNLFFRAILQLQMNDYRYHYMFTTFDIETFDLEDFKYNSVNMTAFRLVDVENEKVSNLLHQMERFQPIGHAILNRSGIIKVGVNGLTGRIEFSEGKRTNFKLDLLKLKREDLRKVGEWSPTGGINITDNTAFYETASPNITLIVMTREERPYVMVKEGNATGNARYEGFCIDLLRSVASQVGFQYAIRLVPDHMYGVYDPETKEWNGIVRELIEKRADLAVASMTINYARESVIDFTKPFMNLGIGILFKVPSSQPTRLFSFMNPLAVEIWLYVLAAYLLVSFTLFVMARFSPYEWNNPHPCSPDAHIIENQFSVSNSFWFITGTFLRQGSGLNPKTSERMPNRMFSFLNPLAVEIWVWMVAAYVVVSLTIWLVARFSPREWTSPACSCSPSADPLEDNDGGPLLRYTYEHVLQNDFTLGNAFWFTIGSLMQQGSDLNPKATSTRIVGGIWWFFTLIIISSYTANLAAFLTVERMITPIESAADLSEQTDIAYGTLSGGSTMTFFRIRKLAVGGRVAMNRHNKALE
ncbi:unnamed protein product [Nesidiocoris tenuis]|uniref:Ionotropic glutamate receptor L-glutamate and glycine-binding domain-containing protein n=1 Tax=Nesidiocoris tenuis TaxID=355587 RepID=A0A6H5H003_9HEMI|nr:unnamed protein product [Nesidiocoris tenuis]